jgi:hypothetical protein
MAQSSWLLEAIEKAAVNRALEELRGSEGERHIRILGLSIQQVIFLKHEWMKAHPGEEVPGYK